MKTLTIVRHAKSDWGNDTLHDVYRPLNERGYMDAQVIAKQISKKIEKPDYWLTSPAIRAYSTALIFANVFKFDTEKIVFKQKIYGYFMSNKRIQFLIFLLRILKRFHEYSDRII